MKRLLVILLMTDPLLAALPGCKNNPKVVAACYSVRGRLTPGADTVRIYLWPVGTKRMLGVTGGPSLDDAEAPVYPGNLKFPSVNNVIYGDFEVCPFTLEEKGHLQLVCIESATHLVTRH